MADATRDLLAAIEAANARAEKFEKLVEAQRIAFDDMRDSYDESLAEIGEKLRLLSNAKIKAEAERDELSAHLEESQAKLTGALEGAKTLRRERDEALALLRAHGSHWINCPQYPRWVWVIEFRRAGRGE